MAKILRAAAALLAMWALAGCASSGPLARMRLRHDLPRNPSFYTGGSFARDGRNAGGAFDPKAAEEAYRRMCARLGCPAPKGAPAQPGPGSRFRATDFRQGDFAHYGMGFDTWADEIREEYSGADIYLLPGQSLAEHRHLPTHIRMKDAWTGKDYEKDLPCKTGSWLVRAGWVYGFSSAGEPNLDRFPEARDRLSTLLTQVNPRTGKALLQCRHVEKWVADGVAHKFVQDENWHFLMGGADGAVISEAANYHDGQGIGFSVPGAGL